MSVLIGPAWEHMSILESLWLKGFGIFLKTLGHIATLVTRREEQLVKSHHRPKKRRVILPEEEGRDIKQTKQQISITILELVPLPRLSLAKAFA